MLDSDTRRKIDTLRDILVGKIPNPQTQVEQITTGLIYKFMDDMDQESIEMGGKGSFFVGDYEKYAWKNLLDPKLSGVDKVNLYSQAIESMYLNPSAPQLFRDIFKNAFLPFKDPSTLNMFLKEINEFHYSHSEKLGDAFEYLISIMGSQGDAGQFRTPRHIIDFIVEIIDPQKNETILDPACGTAGFLISSYRHILKTNTDKKLGDQLSAEDKKKVGENVSGYDISPEMIRLSLVNMYLHGFSTPKIDEYDTLSSEDKWNEYYDVILANPPFFSPKGGIQPHKRFGVDSKKAEVLFTSYILDHLKPNGRAAIIIPEGIIFQTGKAYKELRKQLIENGLVGVISLPAGVFNPYTGVKTSILVLDKAFNKSSESIIFADIKNDGFDLGANRLPIKDNDLFQVLDDVKNFLNNNFKEDNSIVFTIPKDRILSHKDTSLSLSIYKQNTQAITDYDSCLLSDASQFIRGITFAKKDQLKEPTETSIKVATTKAAQSDGLVNKDLYNIESFFVKDEKKYLKQNDILISLANSLPLIGRTTLIKNLNAKTSFGAFMGLIRANKEKINPLLLYYFLRSKYAKDFFLANARTTTNISNLSFDSLGAFRIPLPPLEVQQEIVDELEGYQKIIDGCKQVVENYKPTIDIDPSWEMFELGDVYESNLDSKRIPITKSDREEGDIPYYGASGIVDYVKDFIFDERLLLVSEDGANLKDRNYPIAFSISGKSWVNNHAHVLKFGSYENQKFIEFYLNKISLEPYITGSAQPKINQSALNSIKVPNPSMEIQKEIVKRIEEEKKIIEGNKKFIEIYTQKIQDRINKVWGE